MARVEWADLKPKVPQYLWFAGAVVLFFWGGEVRQFFWLAILAGGYCHYARLKKNELWRSVAEERERWLFVGFAFFLAIMHGLLSMQDVERDRMFWRDVNRVCGDYSDPICERISEARDSSESYSVFPSDDE